MVEIEVREQSAAAATTDIRWRVSLRPALAGTGGPLRWLLRRLYAGAATGLARAAEAGPSKVRS
jgi:hypothetical protein